MLQSWVSFSSWLLFFLFIEKMGERQLAVSAIIKNIYMLFLIPIWGFAASTNTLTSNLLGEGRTNEVPGLLKKIILMASCILALPVGICMFFPRQIISIFSSNPELIAQTIGPLYVVCVALLFFPMAMVMFNGVSGSVDTRFALYIELFTIALYISYLYIMTQKFKVSMTLVWTSEIVYMLLLSGMSFLRLRSGKWKGRSV